MALDPTKNFAKAAVLTGYNDAATSIMLSTGSGALFPDPAVDGAFNVVWFNNTDYTNPADDPNVEIVRVTGKTDDTLTITRAQEGTVASNKNTVGKSYKIMLAVTSKTISDIAQEIIDNTPSRGDIYGDGSDGDITISTNTSLSSDMQYNNLTINDGIILNSNGWKIFIKDTLTFLGTGKIASNGGSGGNGGNANYAGWVAAGSSRTLVGTYKGAAGLAGAAAYTSTNSLLDTLAGKAGVAGGTTYGTDTSANGTAGDSVTKSLSFTAGAVGGTGGGLTNEGLPQTSRPGGAGGLAPNGIRPIRVLHNLDFSRWIDTAGGTIGLYTLSASSGSGASGRADDTGWNDCGAGGGSGGSGGNGGMILIIAKSVVTVSGNTYIEATGGSGGNGGTPFVGIDPGTSSGGDGAGVAGSGGGGGGQGGVVILVYSQKIGAGIINVSGGAGGVGSAGVKTSDFDAVSNGGNGGTGNSGKSYLFNI